MTTKAERATAAAAATATVASATATAPATAAAVATAAATATAATATAPAAAAAAPPQLSANMLLMKAQRANMKKRTREGEAEPPGGVSTQPAPYQLMFELVVLKTENTIALMAYLLGMNTYVIKDFLNGTIVCLSTIIFYNKYKYHTIKTTYIICIILDRQVASMSSSITFV
jgi:hypothetical protein